METKSNIKKEIESLMQRETKPSKLSSEKPLLQNLLNETKVITNNLQNLNSEALPTNENSDLILTNLEGTNFDRDYNKFDRDYNKFDRDYNKFDRGDV